jgi:hypothetical protein
LQYLLVVFYGCTNLPRHRFRKRRRPWSARASHSNNGGVHKGDKKRTLNILTVL